MDNNMNADVHRDITLKRYKLGPEDGSFFWNIHDFMDCSKEVTASNNHRMLTHHMFFVKRVMIPVFGSSYRSVDGKTTVNIKDCLETDHILADYKHKFLTDLSDYSDLIIENYETEQALNQIAQWKIEFKNFWDANPDIFNFINEPLNLTGNPYSLLITWNSWWLGKIVPLVHKIEVPFIGLRPPILFNNLKEQMWIHNGRELLPRMRKVEVLDLPAEAFMPKVKKIDPMISDESMVLNSTNVFFDGSLGGAKLNEYKHE